MKALTDLELNALQLNFHGLSNPNSAGWLEKFRPSFPRLCVLRFAHVRRNLDDSITAYLLHHCHQRITELYLSFKSITEFWLQTTTIEQKNRMRIQIQIALVIQIQYQRMQRFQSYVYFACICCR